VRNVVLAIVLLVGCKDKTKTETPKSGSGTAVVKAPGSNDKPLPGQNELRLPKLAGTPPVKTAKPIDKTKAEALSKPEFEGFQKDVRLANDQGIDVRYMTKERPHILVTVNATKCFDCIAMDLEKWKAKTDSLKVLVGPELKDRPDTTFEMGLADINGGKYLWTYHVGFNITPDPGTGIAGAYGTAYAIHYNDGVNMIRVVAEYKDDVPKSREDMVNLTPKEDLEQIGKAFIDYFVHYWN
jgi:hypothetical protein